MHESHVIEVNGVFLGAVVGLRGSGLFRFVATDPSVTGLDGSLWTDLDYARARAAALYRVAQPAPVRVAAGAVSGISAIGASPASVAAAK
jgi:hypothetical protein